MDEENLYAPPRSQVDSPAQMSGDAKRRQIKRPASHKWALFFLTFVAFSGFSTFVLAINRGYQMTPFSIVLLAFSGALTIPFLSLVFFRYSRVTYYIVSITLGLALLRFGWLSFTLSGSLSGRGAPLFFGFGLWSVGLVFLCWKFIFGTPSRAYYGFVEPLPEIEKVEPSSDPARPKRSGGWNPDY